MAHYLIVVNMQRDLVSGAQGSPEAQAVAPAVAARIRAARESGVQVFFTLYSPEEDAPKSGSPCAPGTVGWTLEPAVAAECARGMRSFESPAPGCVALMRHMEAQADTLGAHRGDGMAIELCGVHTDTGVVSNALLLRAALPRAQILVHPSLCAGSCPSRHLAALETMRACGVRACE